MKIIAMAILMLVTSFASAYQVDENDYNLLAYRESKDGTVTILRNQRGTECPTGLNAMYQEQPDGEVVRGCWTSQEGGNFLIFYGVNYHRQMIMKIKDFHAGPAYRGKFKELPN
jgi:hypothetical protein